jgi:RNA polymerase sigma-70 factor (ECF subfamily)
MRLLLPVSDNIFRFISAMERDTEVAKDIMGDTLLIAYEKIDSLSHEQAFLSWMLTIARRVFYRKNIRKKLFGWFDEEHVSETTPSDTLSPEAATDITFLHTALQKLPAKQREALVLFEIVGLSLEEIRQIQGGSLSAIKMRLVRGREKLAILLKGTSLNEEQVQQKETTEQPVSLKNTPFQKNQTQWATIL